jgi:hypothetical protein
MHGIAPEQAARMATSQKDAQRAYLGLTEEYWKEQLGSHWPFSQPPAHSVLPPGLLPKDLYIGCRIIERAVRRHFPHHPLPPDLAAELLEAFRLKIGLSALKYPTPSSWLFQHEVRRDPRISRAALDYLFARANLTGPWSGWQCTRQRWQENLAELRDFLIQAYEYPPGLFL